MKDRLSKVEMENTQLREENGMYKGRCTNLARDVEMHYNEMHKLNDNTNHHASQNKILNERVGSLEKDVEEMRLARNSAQEEARRLSQANEVIEKELILYRTKQIKAEGDSHSSNATVARLQSQLNGKQNDVDLMLQAKTEMERALKEARQEILKAEKSRDDVYKQLVSNKENLDIMTNEQMILS